MAGEARKILAQNLRLLRFQRGWSQEELAALAGMHSTTLSRVERGVCNIGLDHVERLALALEVTVSGLLGEWRDVC